MDLLESLRNYQFQQDTHGIPSTQACDPGTSCGGHVPKTCMRAINPWKTPLSSIVKPTGFWLPNYKKTTNHDGRKQVHLWFEKKIMTTSGLGSSVILWSNGFGCHMYSSSCSKDMRLANTPIQTKNTLETWEFICLLRIAQGKHRSQKRKGNKESSGHFFVSVWQHLSHHN